MMENIIFLFDCPSLIPINSPRTMAIENIVAVSATNSREKPSSTMRKGNPNLNSPKVVELRNKKIIKNQKGLSEV